jgi:hypothetical protein
VTTSTRLLAHSRPHSGPDRTYEATAPTPRVDSQGASWEGLASSGDGRPTKPRGGETTADGAAIARPAPSVGAPRLLNDFGLLVAAPTVTVAVVFDASVPEHLVTVRTHRKEHRVHTKERGAFERENRVDHI